MGSIPSQSGANFTAIAGHTTTSGAYCNTCGCGDCICDPGETPGDCSGGRRAVVENSGSKTEFDYGAGALILATLLFLWLRVKA